MAEDFESKREFPRALCDIKAEYRTTESFLGAYMKQVGLGGLFIENDDPPPMGEEIELSFSLPDDTHIIKAKGKVVWRMMNPTHDVFAKGVGVKFIEISDKDKKKISDFVESHNVPY